MIVTPVMQFGTSRFLQAHADLFISEALEMAPEAGEAAGLITVVKTSKDAGRESRLAGLARPEGFPVRIRGLKDGVVVDETRTVRSVARALSTARDWDEVARIFVEEVSLVISNTAEGGYDLDPAERDRPDGIPVSFPGKLTALLAARHRAGGKGLTIIPTELVSRNGAVLSTIIRTLARDWYRDPAFDAWLDQDVIIASSLVDRIVSAALEPAGAVAEPYALWAIERKSGMTLPCRHPAIVVTDDISSHERLKLFILNLGHTILVQHWIDSGGRADLTVREIIADPLARARLRTIYDAEILPGFAAQGLGAAAPAYVEATLERFANPFLDHYLRDIRQHHDEKIRRRAGGFLDWAGHEGRPELSALLARAKPA